MEQEVLENLWWDQMLPQHFAYFDPPKGGISFQLYISMIEFILGIMLAKKNNLDQYQATYYLSRIFMDYELFYIYMEHLYLAIIFMVKKLHHYILNHMTFMISRTNPLQYMMRKTYHNSRTSKWLMFL